MADITVTGLTAARMLLESAQQIIGASINAAGDVTFTRRDGSTIAAGNVKGPQGDPGPAGHDGVLTGDLEGNYPNPTIGLLKVTAAKIADGAVTRIKLAAGIAVPTGGTSGQVLKKNSGTDGDYAWGAAPAALPTGGTTGQILRKNSATDGDAGWATGNPKFTYGRQAFTTDASGDITIPHGLGATPSAFWAHVASHEGQGNMTTAYTADATNFYVRLRNSSGAVITGVSRTYNWMAIA
jgi:hypothetical protein